MERSVLRTLAELLEAGEIATRRKSSGTNGDRGLIRLGPEPDEYITDKVTFSNCERLAARGMARRVVETHVSSKGRVETEKFVPTELGADALFFGMDHFDVPRTEEVAI
jgi:hypothetical protein